MRLWKPIGWVSFALGLCAVAAVIAEPLLIKGVLARFRSTDHFLVLDHDDRVRYEATAKTGAEAVADILSDRQDVVETILGASFQQPVQVFICATQESFNQYVFLSRNARGATYWGKIFLSPGAFQRGSLSRLVTHELTHYLFHSYLGRNHVRNVPLWFREGVADYVANGGPSYTADRELRRRMIPQDRQALLSGDVDFWFETNDPGDAVTSNGVANVLLYRPGALFVHFIHDTDPEGFDALIQALLFGEPFDPAFTSAFDQSVRSMLAAFKDYLAG